MNNKQLFEDWLTRFKRNINGKKFTAVKSYMKYMAAIEKQLGMEKDSIYSISTPAVLKKLEVKLRKAKSFNALSDKYRANLLSALHVFQNRIEILSMANMKNKKDGSTKGK